MTKIPAAQLLPLPPALVGRGIALWPEAEVDKAFLAGLYAATRWGELARTGWNDAQKQAFLGQQWMLQDLHYRRHYADAERSIVTIADVAAGRLCLLRQPDEWRLVDIALLPQHCGQGVGAALIGAICRQAAAAGLPVSLHVAIANPAGRLYGRLGFRATGMADGVYCRMEWRPPDAAA